MACILGGHGITAWGSTSDEAEANSRWIIETARRYIDAHGGAVTRSARPDAARAAAPDAERRAESGGASPRTCERIASHDQRMVGHFTDTDEVLEFLAAEKLFALAELGTSCPDHFLRTKIKPLVLDLRYGRTDRRMRRPSRRAARAVSRRLRRLLRTARRRRDSPPMRGADPAIILVPGVGMFSYGRDKQTARVAGEFYVNAINVMRGAEAVSTYAPISGVGEVPHRVLGARGGQAATAAEAEATRRAYRAGHRRGERHRPSHRRHSSLREGACVVIADLDDAEGRRAPPARSVRRDQRSRGRGRRERRRRGAVPRSTRRCSPSGASTWS